MPVPRSAIWTDEIERPGPSYWIDSLRRAIAVAPPGAQLRFLIGSDRTGRVVCTAITETRTGSVVQEFLDTN